jgi:hypothetical protein
MSGFDALRMRVFTNGEKRSNWLKYRNMHIIGDIDRFRRSEKKSGAFYVKFIRF